MNWKTTILATSVLISLILGITSFTGPTFNWFRVPMHFSSSSYIEIPLTRDVPITGLALSGAWTGKGFAQVLLVTPESTKLVLDTRAFIPGNIFDHACFNTCSFSPVYPEKLVIMQQGQGSLSLHSSYISLPSTAVGLAICDSCKTVPAMQAPDHSSLLLVLLLLISIYGAYVLHHSSFRPFSRKITLSVFIGAFVVLGSVFGVSTLAPITPFAQTAQQFATIFAGLGVFALFFIGGFEIRKTHKLLLAEEQTIWKDLEEAEEKWEK